MRYDQSGLVQGGDYVGHGEGLAGTCSPFSEKWPLHEFCSPNKHMGIRSEYLFCDTKAVLIIANQIRFVQPLQEHLFPFIKTPQVT